MMIIKVFEDRWLRGMRNTGSCLRNKANMQCCLGFWADQCGFEYPDGTTSPSCIPNIKDSDMTTRGRNTVFCSDLMGINDSMLITDEQRKIQLNKIAFFAGIQFEFYASESLLVADGAD